MHLRLTKSNNLSKVTQYRWEASLAQPDFRVSVLSQSSFHRIGWKGEKGAQGGKGKRRLRRDRVKGGRRERG